MKATEEWRPIQGFERFYRASSFGRVESLWNGSAMLKPVRRSNGYMHVQLCDGINPPKQASVHTLIAAAFLGPRPEGHDVSHIDGDKSNNSAANLRYESHSANCLRRREHGTEYIPSSAKLTLDQVEKIHSLRRSGLLQREIAQALGITQSNVSRILSGILWPNVRQACQRRNGGVQSLRDPCA